LWLIICDQKLASDSSGLSGGFSGQRAWVRIFKKWAPGSYCLELVVKLVQLPGQVLSFSDASESIRKNLIPCELNNWFIQFLSNSPGNSKCLLKCALVRGIGNVTLRNFVNWNFEPVHINDLIQYLILVLSRKLSFTGDLVTYLWINLKLIQLRWKKKTKGKSVACVKQEWSAVFCFHKFTTLI
jgi:hypothetical protein